jgi:hypothetical protein
MRGCEDWERLRDGDPAAARLRMAILTDNEYRLVTAATLPASTPTLAQRPRPLRSAPPAEGAHGERPSGNPLDPLGRHSRA